MIDLRYKPPHLPQISAPYTIVVDELNKMGVSYSQKSFDPNILKPSQGFTFCDDFKTSDDPIWIAGKDDDENVVLDGHHRYVNSLSTGTGINGIKLDMVPKDACRLLNKIQDIYEYKNTLNLEETELNNTINFKNDINNDEEKSWLDEFEKNVGVGDAVSDAPNDSVNKKTLIGYRNVPVSKTSIIGNFFLLEPTEGYDKYEIEFDNLLDLSDGMSFLDGQSPVDVLVNIWYPNIDFESESLKHNTTSDKLKKRCVSEKAKKMGYDGIKYGNSIIQGIN